MRRKLIPSILVLCMLLTLLPGAALGDTGGVLTVNAAVDGADVYVDGVLCGVTPLSDVPVSAGAHSVRVELPGYTPFTCEAFPGDTVSAPLTPELYPAAYADRCITLTVTEDYSLGDALADVYADTADNWYVIGFASDITEIAFYGELYLNSRGRFTVNGEGRVSVTGGSIRINASDVRVVGLSFTGSSRNTTALQLRAADDNSDAKALSSVYVLGCTFTDCFEVGVANCGLKGCGGTGCGAGGASSVTDLVFAGNTFNGTSLFSFAGAGDEDYNVMDGYKICGNSFTDCGVGMLAADAHSWYVYGYDQSAAPGYCENNVLRNVLISGNRFTMTENATREYEGIISVGCANLGNSGNLTENVEIRHNVSRITGGAKNVYSSVSICNVGISDRYSGKDYDNYITDGMEHTDNNILRNVSVHDNDFALGDGRAFQIYNATMDVGEQCGANNAMTDIRIENNSIKTCSGVEICNYKGNTHSGLSENNSLSAVLFSGNTVFRTVAGFADAGILVAGSYISQHGEKTDAYPAYSGSCSDISILENTVTGFGCGILAAAAAGDYGSAMTLKDVTVSGNVIVNQNLRDYPIADFGIIAAGAAFAVNGEGDYAPRGSINCALTGAVISDNTVTARCGIALCGLFASEGPTYPQTGNQVKNITVTGNTLNQRALCEGDGQQLAGILCADVIEIWYKLGFTEKDCLAFVSGNRALGITVGENTVSGDFTVPEALYQESSCFALDNNWQWIRENTGDTEGKVLNRSVNGAYGAKRAVNDLWVYRNFTVSGGFADADVADGLRAKAAIEAFSWAVQQTKANSLETVKSWIEEQLPSLIQPGIAFAAALDSLTPALAGSADTPAGTAGAFAFTVTLSIDGRTLSEIPVSGGVIEPKAYTLLLGDADGNEALTTADASHIVRYVVKLVSAEDIDLAAADTDGDGEVTVFDAARLLRYLVHLIPEL